MPSQFATRFSQTGGALDALHDQFAVSATYSDKTENSVSCSLRLRKSDPVQLQGATRGAVTGEVNTATGDVRVSQVAKPILAGRFTTEDGEVWEISKTPYHVNGMWKLALSKTTADRRGSMKGGTNA